MRVLIVISHNGEKIIDVALALGHLEGFASGNVLILHAPKSVNERAASRKLRKALNVQVQIKESIGEYEDPDNSIYEQFRVVVRFRHSNAVSGAGLIKGASSILVAKTGPSSITMSWTN
ncbi:MAG: hypothetical protein ABII13_02355 [Patescibacteria group bacterium]|nr:hypothetical protein [Patescibacteria group bacterium]MBU2508826.1 hypothetical protein [Patescibacteria group bacterium]